MAQVGIKESDLEEAFAPSSGPGGQNVNKVASAVTLCHRPSGISVTAQDSRSQVQNRKLARERLIDAIEQAQQKRRATEIAQREKARRRRSPRPPGLKRRILEAKRKRGELKKQRAKIDI
jgi:protein subunit release factor B